MCDATRNTGKQMKTTDIEFARLPGCGDLPLPRYMSEAASGMDVFAAVVSSLTIEPGDIKLIPTGLCMAVPPGFEVQVRPRSGLALKHGIMVANSPGTIDSDYRGEVKIILANIGRRPFVVDRGMRIAQIVIQEVVRGRPIERESLDDTERGAGGFGHTGV